MLKKNNRLKKSKDFNTVQRFGRSVRNDFLFLKFFSNNRENSRIGFVVSSKFSKKANERNLMKRRLREISRELFPQIRQGYDICMFVSKKSAKPDFLETKEAVKKALKKADLIQEKK